MGDLPSVGETAMILEENANKSPPHDPGHADEKWKQPQGTIRKPATSLSCCSSSALEKKLEKKLLHKGEKLHELRNRCAQLLKMEKRCHALHNELSLKSEHVQVLTQSQACMQQQVDDAERKHTEDLTLLVRALERSKGDLGSQAQLIEILVRDLQKMKSTLEFCKDELLLKEERVKRLEDDLRKAKPGGQQHESRGASKGARNTTTPSKIHGRAQAAGLQTGKRKSLRPGWHPLPNPVHDPEQCMDSWQKERTELQAMVAKLTREGELWTFEKAMLVSALHAAKKEFNHQHEKLSHLQEKVRKSKSSSKCTCETPHCHRVVEKHHHHCAVCKKKEEKKQARREGTSDQSHEHIIISLGEQLRKQMQLHYDLEEKLRSTKKQLSQSNKKLKTLERDRVEMTEKLTQARMSNYDMEYQMSLLHDSLLESSARLEHVTYQLRESCNHKASVQKSLECSLVSLQEASVDVVLENSAKQLEFKSMKLLQRLMATRLRWGSTTASDYQLFIDNGTANGTPTNWSRACLPSIGMASATVKK